MEFLRSYLESEFVFSTFLLHHPISPQPVDPEGGRTFSSLSPIAFWDLPQRKDLTHTKSYFESLYSYIFNRFYSMQKRREIEQFILTVCPIGRISFRFPSPLFLEIGFLSPYLVSQFANRDKYTFSRSLSRLLVLFFRGVFFFSFSMFRNSVRSSVYTLVYNSTCRRFYAMGLSIVEFPYAQYYD